MELLIVLLIVFWILGLPRWPYSRGWGYFPSGLITLILLILLLSLLF
ncbi:MAG: DUF3309 domain-containing protein [Gemmatimonadetes bacterium]|nr:DUF3309 domain-containing protein [Gemmatimonadota bacterium]